MNINPRLAILFKDYAENHQHPVNQKIHAVAIPAIVLSTLGVLAVLGKGFLIGGTEVRLDLAQLLLVSASFWYITLDWRLGLPFSLIGAGFYFLGRAIPLPAHLAIFILSWFFQFIGHYRYEKKSPKFFQNLKHLLIGPLWVFAKIARPDLHS